MRGSPALISWSLPASYALVILVYMYTLYTVKYIRMDFMTGPAFLSSLLLALPCWVYTGIILSFETSKRSQDRLVLPPLASHIALLPLTLTVFVLSTMMLNPALLGMAYVWKTLFTLSLQTVFHISVNLAIRAVFPAKRSRWIAAIVFYIVLPTLFTLSVFGHEIQHPAEALFARFMPGYFYPAVVYNRYPEEYENLSFILAIIYMTAASTGLRLLAGKTRLVYPGYQR